MQLVLVDTSYYIFMVYFNVRYWYINNHGELDPNTLLKNRLFMDRYDATFAYKVKSLVGRRVVFVKDCPRRTIWRVKLFPTYKHGRVTKSDSVFNKEIFNYTYTKCIPELLKTRGYSSLEFPELEADDIIALVVKDVASPSVNITIVTNDKDYVQLLRYPGIRINNLLKQEMPSYDPDEFLVRKIILGDRSDNIPSIADDYLERKRLMTLIDEGDVMGVYNYMVSNGLMDRFEFNKTLIDFSYIPCDISERFYDSRKYERWRKNLKGV